MEGLNVGGFLLGYIAVLVFGIVSLVALGLLIGRLTRASRILFASGLFLASLIAVVAILSFLSPSYHPGETWPLLVLAVLALSAAGSGQFIAALRSTRVFAASICCAAISFLLLTVPMFGGEWPPPNIRGLIPKFIPNELYFFPIMSLLFAVGSILFAALLSPGSARKAIQGPLEKEKFPPSDEVDPTGITVWTKENISRGRPPS